MNQHFFLLAPRLPHLVQGAKGTANSDLRYIMAGEEKKAAKEYNCPMVPVSSDGDADDVAVAVEHFVLGAGRSRRRELPGRGK